jgi:hypothetical protein
VWPNLQNGEAALHIAAQVCGVEGMNDEEGAALIEELTEFATQA